MNDLLTAVHAYVATLPQCNQYSWGPEPEMAPIVCRKTATWNDRGLYACDEHGGPANPWGRELVEVHGAAALREILAHLAAQGPDRGRIINAAASAGAAVVEATERLARVRNNSKATMVDRERARVALVGAEARKTAADAQLRGAAS